MNLPSTNQPKYVVIKPSRNQIDRSIDQLINQSINNSRSREGHLEVRTGDAASELFEQGRDDLFELLRLYDVQNLLHLPKEHHLTQTHTLT